MENCSETNECEKKYSTDDVAYTGPNLTCTGIETCDNLTTIITKINNFICGPEFVQTVINNIINNTVLYNQFTTIVNEVVECDTVLDCLTTTTTTTAPTTTTTTTAISLFIFFGPTISNACENNYFSISITLDSEATDICDASQIFGNFSPYGLNGQTIYVHDSINNPGLVRSFIIDISGNFAVQNGLCEPCPGTTTTTTLNPDCGDFMIQAFEPEGSWEAVDCSGTPVSGSIIGNDSQATGCIIIDSLVLTNAFIKNGPDPC